MRSNEPPERSPRDVAAQSTPGDPQKDAGLPPYSARWATGARLAAIAFIILVIAAVLARRFAGAP
jgi:hypothetical protein